jgi:hypothetical protein
LTRRFSYGLQFRGNYTFSKSLDTHSSSFLANSGVGGTTTLLDPQDPRRDWGPSNFNVKHRLTANFSYQLPVGRGKGYLGNVTGAPDRLISGWQVNGIITVQSGFPFTPLVGFNQSGNGDSRAPDRVSVNPNFSGPMTLGKPGRWYDPNAFLLPPPGTYGNAGRDILFGPGEAEFDASVFKNFRITEKAAVQFRGEIFNLFNRPNFGLPIISTFTSAGGISPSAGLITYTATTSRQIQFGLKLNW